MVTWPRIGPGRPALVAGACCGLLLALAAAATAQSGMPGLKLRPGMTGVPDLGAIRCETFNRMHPAGPTGMEQAVLTWAEGYIYGRSGQTIDELLAASGDSPTDWNFATLTGHIVAFCAAEPDAGIPDAVADLWLRLQPTAAD